MSIVPYQLSIESRLSTKKAGIKGMTLYHNLALQLKRAGHDIVVKADSTGFGRGEIIWRDDNGILCGACEPRTDGYVAVW